MHGYIHPECRNIPFALEWDAYLHEHLNWTPDDFGGGYAWNGEPPPRETWAEEVAALNEHLEQLDPMEGLAGMEPARTKTLYPFSRQKRVCWPPKIYLHKSSGRARIRWEGKDYYLGPFGSAEATKNYDLLIQEITRNPNFRSVWCYVI